MSPTSVDSRSGPKASARWTGWLGLPFRPAAVNVEGPAYEDARYYAVFFEDPSGNHLEICYRESQ